MEKYLKYPHSLKVTEVLNELQTNSNGLTSKEAQRRLTLYGPNEIPEGRSVSIFYLIFKQFKSWLVIILIIAAVISWFANHVLDTWVIIAVVFINAGIGFIQEYRADKAIASLRKMIVKTAKLLRNGKVTTEPSVKLVPGDILVLEEGDRIPADGRIVYSKNLRTMEASLTGESLPVSKNEGISLKELSQADRKNMVWKGTFVAAGYAKVVVTGTGIHTAIGKISETLAGIKVKQTNFMKKTDVLAKQMSVIAISSALIIFLIGYFYRHFNLQEILLISIAALVAAVPEGLPAVISIVLAIGAYRMAKRNAIVSEFTATETLGAVTAILTDKTGTLTKNMLTVRNIFIPGSKDYSITGVGWFPIGNFLQNKAIIGIEKDKSLQKLLKIAAASNNSEFRHDKQSDTYELIGDPTEGALSVLARKGGVKSKFLHLDKLDDLPFDSTNKYRATLIKEGENIELFVTGAPEIILERSISILTYKGVSKLQKSDKEQIKKKIREWSDQAMRVIALAYKKQNINKIDEKAIDNLVIVGITGMIDPPRPDAKAAVEKCKQAGIRVIMVTGDHVNTAVAIAKATGIIEDTPTNNVVALTEQQLLQLDKVEFDKAIRNISVFARLTPKMKLKIAKHLQSMEHLIAMTGDGVNDAPALKQADVGISMGIMGTDVARDSSDLVLADDNFASVVNAVEEGRIVFTNSRQTSFFLVTTNIAESFTLLISILLGLPMPLTATQILWLNLVTDGVTVMALATEPGHGDIMKSKPMSKNENILNKEVLPFLFINIVLMVGLSIAAFYYYNSYSIEKGRTGVFIIMAFTQLFNVFNLRNIHKSVFEIGVFSNKYINLSIGVSVLLLIMVTEVPILATLFHFKSLYIVDLFILFVLSSLVLWTAELYKYLHKKK